MYKACIIEDEEPVRMFFRSTLERLFSLENISVSFDEYSNGDSFLSSMEDHQHYDIYFLDIEMPGINGIELCRRIRRIKSAPLVVFISNKESLVFDTFEVEPFRFIRKRFFDELAPDLVKALKVKLEETSGDSVTITESYTGSIYSFDMNDLLYVEAQRKDCCFVTKADSTVIRITFQEVMDLLESRNFVQTHRSYCVNLRHIFFIGKDEVELTTKDVVPISRSKISEVKSAFMDFSMRQ